MIRSLIIGFFAAIIFVIIATYLFLKAYKEPQIFYDNLPALTLVYKSAQGDYSQTAVIVAEVEESLGFSCKKSFGLFFDDPEEIASQDLVSWAGCVLPDIPKSLPSDLSIYQVVEQRNILVAVYEGSPALGPIKVYPKARQLSPKLFPALEVYAIEENDIKTSYFFNLSASN